MNKLMMFCVLMSLPIGTTSSFAACISELKCVTRDRALVFIHEVVEAGLDPATDSSELTYMGEKKKLLGVTSSEDGETAIPGEYVWSEILLGPTTPVYSLTPTTGVGEVFLSIVENAKSRSKVTKKMSGGIGTDTYTFKGRLTLWGEEGSKTKFPVSCKSSVSCD